MKIGTHVDKLTGRTTQLLVESDTFEEERIIGVVESAFRRGSLLTIKVWMDGEPLLKTSIQRQFDDTK